MTALVARLRPRWQTAVGAVADVAGVAVRNIGRGLPGIAGPLLVCWGVSEIYRPAAWIVAGVFLLLLDRRVS